MTNEHAMDMAFLEEAYQEAELARSEGNLPVGSVIVLDGKIVARGRNHVIVPNYNPGRHAESEAIRTLDVELWSRANEMILYTTLEPCIMCMGTIILHGIGRVVFGASDKNGGAAPLLEHLPAYYTKGGVPNWVGPIDELRGNALFQEVLERFQKLPCAVEQ